MRLNERAAQLVDDLVPQTDALRVGRQILPCGADCWDFGIHVPGGLEAGRLMAQVAMAGLGYVNMTAADPALWTGPAVCVRTDHPVLACMAAQYAGWQIQRPGFFAMASGPMRCVARHEALVEKLGYVEQAQRVVGLLETRQLPTDELCRQIATECGTTPSGLHLLVAPTASQAGTVQVVARTIETALHKLVELDFDIWRIESGFGVAPLPPIAGDDLEAIGRTNDAVLYGSTVILWARGDDTSLEQIVSQIPSSSSPDHGRPFREIFESYERDFYRIDPRLFSPAVVRIWNRDTGHSFHAGRWEPDLIRRSFSQ